MAAMSRESVDKIVNDHFMYEATDDIEGVLRTFTDDAEHEVVGGPDGPLRGKPALCRFYGRLFPDFKGERVEPVMRLYGDDFVIDETVWFGHVVDGRIFRLGGRSGKARIRMLHVFKLRDGLIAKENLWFDFDDLARQLGAHQGAGEDKFMSATPAPQRIELSPAVRAILEADAPKSQLLRHFLRFTEAIIAPDPAGIDRVVSPDARFHELEAIGYPRGPEGFKVFRRQVNAAVPDEHISVINVRFAGDDIIEADLDISATHTGEEFMGIPATGRKIRFEVHARGRFVDGKMAERWDQADFADIKRQLSGPTR